MAQQEELNIIWRPFELRPEGVPPLDPNSEYIRSGWKNHVLPLAEQLGVTMRTPPVQPRTRLAHEASAFARTQGREAAMADALFKAFFQEGRDIGQIEVLCDIGLHAGVDPVQLRACLEERTMQKQVEEELELSRRYGIDAVPFFIFGGKYSARGLQSEETIRRAINLCRGEGLIQLEE